MSKYRDIRDGKYSAYIPYSFTAKQMAILCTINSITVSRVLLQFLTVICIYIISTCIYHIDYCVIFIIPIDLIFNVVKISVLLHRHSGNNIIL